MKDLLRSIYETHSNTHDTLGILYLEKTRATNLLTEQFDGILIALERSDDHFKAVYDIKHYNYIDKRVAMHIIDEKQLNNWLSSGIPRRILVWLMSGTIIYEKDLYISELRKTVHLIPTETRKKKIGIEFAMLIRSYSYGKELYEGSQFLDAYNEMVRALHHLARLSVIDHGHYPEVTVWKQVKKIEPEVYILYLELVESTESIEKKVELLLLAIEFAISSRSKVGSSYIVEIMKMKQGAWSITELMNEERLYDFYLDLGLVLHYLAGKNIIKVINESAKEKGVFYRKYAVS